jgi:hypothetical protein
MLRTVSGVVIILDLINGFKTFDMIYVMTGGGPSRASEVLGTYLYRLAFGSTAGAVPALGYATAISMVIVAPLPGRHHRPAADFQEGSQCRLTLRRRPIRRRPCTVRRHRPRPNRRAATAHRHPLGPATSPWS